MKKYKDNLSIYESQGYRFVKSYDTIVAEIKGETLIVFGWWSSTTQKHINYIAQELDLTIIKSENYEKHQFGTR